MEDRLEMASADDTQKEFLKTGKTLEQKDLRHYKGRLQQRNGFYYGVDDGLSKAPLLFYTIY